MKALRGTPQLILRIWHAADRLSARFFRRGAPPPRVPWLAPRIRALRPRASHTQPRRRNLRDILLCQ